MTTPEGTGLAALLPRGRVAALGGIGAAALVVLLVVGAAVGGVAGVLVVLALAQLAVVAVVGLLALSSHRRLAATEASVQAGRRALAQRLVRQGRRQKQMAGQLARVHDLVTALRKDHAHEHELASVERKDAVHRRVTLEKRTEQLLLDTQRQVQALIELDRLVPAPTPMPPMGGWVASPDLILLCVRELLERRPATVVECGSGVSTVYLALAAAQHGLPTRIVALEHHERYLDSTRRLLEAQGVADRVDLRLAPLVPSSLVGHDTAWYDEQAIADVADVGMLLVDGPPGDTGPLARYPAVPLLTERMAPQCLVVMDDVFRDEELEISQRWHSENPEFDLDVLRDYQKLAALLSRDRAPATTPTP